MHPSGHSLNNAIPAEGESLGIAFSTSVAFNLYLYANLCIISCIISIVLLQSPPLNAFDNPSLKPLLNHAASLFPIMFIPVSPDAPSITNM